MEDAMDGKVQEILNEVGKVIRGKDEAISLVLTAILARGHILIEDIPGVGKTTLAVSFSRAMELTERRLQFTPDVLPSDVVGFNMLDAECSISQGRSCATSFWLTRSTVHRRKRSQRFWKSWKKDR